jgi:hypothetical protein
VPGDSAFPITPVPKQIGGNDSPKLSPYKQPSIAVQILGFQSNMSFHQFGGFQQDGYKGSACFGACGWPGFGQSPRGSAWIGFGQFGQMGQNGFGKIGFSGFSGL